MRGLRVIKASAEELVAHEARLDLSGEKGGHCLWRPAPASNDETA